MAGCLQAFASGSSATAVGAGVSGYVAARPNGAGRLRRITAQVAAPPINTTSARAPATFHGPASLMRVVHAHDRLGSLPFLIQEPACRCRCTTAVRPRSL